MEWLNVFEGGGCPYTSTVKDGDSRQASKVVWLVQTASAVCMHVCMYGWWMVDGLVWYGMGSS